MDDQTGAFKRALAATLRAERAASGLTRNEVADRTGMSLSTVQRHERATGDPQASQIDAYAKLYGLRSSELIAAAERRLSRQDDTEGTVIHGRFGRPALEDPDAGLDLDYDPDLDAVAHESDGEPTDEQ